PMAVSSLMFRTSSRRWSKRRPSRKKSPTTSIMTIAARIFFSGSSCRGKDTSPTPHGEGTVSLLESAMNAPDPILTTSLSPELLEELLALLYSLRADEWDWPTALPGWTVKDISQHLLADELGNLSWRRDRYSAPGRTTGSQTGSLDRWEDLVAFVNT